MSDRADSLQNGRKKSYDRDRWNLTLNFLLVVERQRPECRQVQSHRCTVCRRAEVGSYETVRLVDGREEPGCCTSHQLN